MRIGPFDFRPGLWPTLATLVLLPFLAGLGAWQLQRADWKQGLVDAHAARAGEPPVELPSLLPPADTDEYRRVRTAGRYDLEHQLLLDNRLHRGAAGYHVLTPLKLDGSGGVLLVNRGWVPLGGSRDELPRPDGPRGPVRILAQLRFPPQEVFRLGTEEERHAGWPQVVQAVELAALERRLGHALLPILLLLDPEDPHGFVRDWKPVHGIPPEKHTAYAMQWFTLAAVLLLIYIGVNTRRAGGDRRAPPPTGGPRQ